MHPVLPSSNPLLEQPPVYPGAADASNTEDSLSMQQASDPDDLLSTEKTSEDTGLYPSSPDSECHNIVAVWNPSYAASNTEDSLSMQQASDPDDLLSTEKTSEDTGLYPSSPDSECHNIVAVWNPSYAAIMEYTRPLNIVKLKQFYLPHTAVIQCDLDRGHPPSNVTWLKDGTVIDFNSDSRITVVNNKHYEQFHIQDFQQSDVGVYQVQAFNNVESAISITVDCNGSSEDLFEGSKPKFRSNPQVSIREEEPCSAQMPVSDLYSIMEQGTRTGIETSTRNDIVPAQAMDSGGSSELATEHFHTAHHVDTISTDLKLRTKPTDTSESTGFVVTGLVPRVDSEDLFLKPDPTLFYFNTSKVDNPCLYQFETFLSTEKTSKDTGVQSYAAIMEYTRPLNIVKLKQFYLPHTAVIQCDLDRGHPPSNVTWLKDGTVIDFNSDSRITVVNNKHYEQFHIQDFQQSDVGVYQVQAFNNVESAISITVDCNGSSEDLFEGSKPKFRSNPQVSIREEEPCSAQMPVSDLYSIMEQGTRTGIETSTRNDIVPAQAMDSGGSSELATEHFHTAHHVDTISTDLKLRTKPTDTSESTGFVVTGLVPRVDSEDLFLKTDPTLFYFNTMQ